MILPSGSNSQFAENSIDNFPVDNSHWASNVHKTADKASALKEENKAHAIVACFD